MRVTVVMIVIVDRTVRGAAGEWLRPSREHKVAVRTAIRVAVDTVSMPVLDIDARSVQRPKR
jgi:hypothetical protein